MFATKQNTTQKKILKRNFKNVLQNELVLAKIHINQIAVEGSINSPINIFTLFSI